MIKFQGGLPTTKLFEINWILPALITVLGPLGVIILYSAVGGNWEVGPKQHMIRLCLGMGLMVFIALINIRLWYSLAYPVYIGALLLLLGVDLFGVVVNNSKRWLDLGVVRVQPSELMKLAIVLALARYYHDLPARSVNSVKGILGALILIALPMQFIFRQPDLGTSLLLCCTGLVIIYLAGIYWRIIAFATLGMVIFIPLFFRFGLKDYQRSRILTLFDSSRDPSGEGYHIIQSKIALGSGGFSGKGFRNGSQGQLNYVPENRTDFIFTVIGEEFGFIGGVATMALYAVIIGLCLWMSYECKQRFSKLMILGLTTTFALYVFINLAMVMGMIPVVGVPLPLISYGGTVMLAVMAGFGFILSAHLHNDTILPNGFKR